MAAYWEQPYTASSHAATNAGWGTDWGEAIFRWYFFWTDGPKIFCNVVCREKEMGCTGCGHGGCGRTIVMIILCPSNSNSKTGGIMHHQSIASNRLREILGSYFPALFLIEVESDYIDAQKMSSQRTELSTYYHEYIHFLQDVSTVYGMINATGILLSVNHMIQLLLQNKDLDENWINNIPHIHSISLKKFCDSYGEIDIDAEETIKNKATIHSFQENNNGTIDIKIIHEQSVYNFSFGGRCIFESMAFEIQKYLFPDVDHSRKPRFP